MGKKVQERLVSEVQRKLELAASSEEKEDRDIVCGEVFADITGELNDAARGTSFSVFFFFFFRGNPAQILII